MKPTETISRQDLANLAVLFSYLPKYSHIRDEVINMMLNTDVDDLSLYRLRNEIVRQLSEDDAVTRGILAAARLIGRC